MKKEFKISGREVKYFRSVTSPRLSIGVINAPKLEVRMIFNRCNYQLTSRLYKLRREYKTAEAIMLKSIKSVLQKVHRANREVK